MRGRERSRTCRAAVHTVVIEGVKAPQLLVLVQPLACVCVCVASLASGESGDWRGKRSALLQREMMMMRERICYWDDKITQVKMVLKFKWGPKTIHQSHSQVESTPRPLLHVQFDSI